MYQDANGQWLNDDGTPMYPYLPSGYDEYIDPANTPAGPAQASPVSDPNSGAGGGDDGGYHPGPLPPLNVPPMRDIPGLPGVGNAPAFNFRAPSVDEALNDPGYQFVLDQGNKSLQRWAAARGTLNDSPTGEALINYGQSAATQQYKNVWDRMFSVAREAYVPQLQTWQAQNERSGLGYSTETGWNQHANDMDYRTAFDKWQAQIDWDKWNAEHGMQT